MAEKAKLIFLNGPSHSGKTTIAKALQQSLDEPFLHFGVSTVVGMLPGQYVGMDETAKEGFYWQPMPSEQGKQNFKIVAGHYGKRVMSGMGYACLTLLQKGLNLIIDDVCYGAEQIQFYVNLFKDFPSLYVGVHCPLEVLHEREALNKAKFSTAIQELGIVHKNIAYDFEVDTSVMTADECADNIRAALGRKLAKSA